MEIKVLGPGCANCHKMEEMAKTAVKELGIDAGIEKITEIQNRYASARSYADAERMND